MSYQYLIHRNLSKKQVIETYESFTFPSFLQKSKVRTLQEPFFVIEALHGEKRVGLSVLELSTQNGLLKILSLFVQEEYRRKGIASQILKIAEKVAQNKELLALNIIFQNNWDSFKIMPKLLKNLAWNEPEKRMILVKLSYKQVKDLPWIQKRSFPTNFSTRPWKSLLPEQYKYIENKQVQEQWYPPNLSPFQMPELVIDESSLALFYKEEIVGWFITHLVANKTIQVTSYFIDEAHRGSKASIAVISNAITKVFDCGIVEQVIFMFGAENNNMVNFTKKIAGEHNTGAFTEVWVGQKKVSIN